MIKKEKKTYQWLKLDLNDTHVFVLVDDYNNFTKNKGLNLKFVLHYNDVFLN